MKTLLLSGLLLGLGLAGCTRQDESRVRTELQKAKEEAKRDLHKAGQEIRKDLNQAKKEVKKGLGNLKDELHGDGRETPRR